MDEAADAFVKHGYDNAVVTDIARRAGVTSGALYFRWPSKNALMAAAVEHLLEDLLPENRIKEFDAAGLSPAEVLAVWAEHLLVGDNIQDVLIQVFASARHHPEVAEHLQRFLNRQAEQLGRLIEEHGAGIPEGRYAAAAVTLTIQAVELGTQLIMSGGLEDRFVPSKQQWRDLHAALLRTAFEPAPPPPTDPD